ncbi:hypothetical protein AALP_AA6G031000 [Arabis alpina]|uniref:Cytosine-specific methyltransferase n=1 Tax=Arabis alpina TaxID=50452 RepID=A0A087GLS5_ARAAL|nr:hypothetical protein AALP_AA6G031000 [Arabis alpina]
MAPKRKSSSTKAESSGTLSKAKKQRNDAIEAVATKRKSSSSEGESSGSGSGSGSGSKRKSTRSSAVVEEEPVEVIDSDSIEPTARFLDEAIPDDEARLIWSDRYKPKVKVVKVVTKKTKNYDDEDNEEEFVLGRRHFRRAIVDETHIFELNDDAHVEAGVGVDPYICKIVEMFEGVDGELYFTAQWYYRAVDTVIELHETLINEKRVFISEIRNANPLNTLVKKLNISRIPLMANAEETFAATRNCDYYCDTKYHLPYSTFEALLPNAKMSSSESSTISNDIAVNGEAATSSDHAECSRVRDSQRTDATLLDLYCGCGAMSTGLCMGAQLAGLNLITKWAVDLNSHACRTMRHNHPETHVRNEATEDYLMLVKEWEKLCCHFCLRKMPNSEEYKTLYGMTNGEDDESDSDEGDDDDDSGEEIFVVEKILGIMCGVDPKKVNKKLPTKGLTKEEKKEQKKKQMEELKKLPKGLYFKVKWKNYGPEHDSWEPVEGLSGCRESIKEFVEHGFKSNILPLPGTVDVVCGGPPCQGISGYNRFRNEENPLEDEKNSQLLVYMNIVEFLKPKYVLMENVVDMLKFVRGYMARYAVGRLVQMNYQTRMGMMAAGAYGLAQFRMRFFLWGVLSSEKLPQFPLPTHDVVVRGVVPVNFERNVVGYNEGHTVELQKKLLLKDCIDDLPPVGNDERREQMRYDNGGLTEFQKFIRLSREEMLGSSTKTSSKKEGFLFDHHPLNLNNDDAERVSRVPKEKGANFRNFPGVIVLPNNVVAFDPDVPRVLLSSGAPLVPDYAMTFVKGTSSKPFGRIWWDETVPTVVTRAEPHNQVIIHPDQHRVLTIRENARLQGFPDYYRLFGPTKQKYMQVGNAVAVPVARALGYSLGMAFQGIAIGDEPLFTLPEGFPRMKEEPSVESLDQSK